MRPALPGAGVTRGRRAGLLAWEVLTTMGHFPRGTPPTLRGCWYHGQRSTEEMVDFYRVTDPDLRQMFIDYLTRRDADLDFTSRWNLASMLVGIFWQEVQRIAPDQRDLRLSPEVYEQWRATVRFRRDGVTVRRDDPADPAGGTGHVPGHPDLGDERTADMGPLGGPVPDPVE